MQSRGMRALSAAGVRERVERRVRAGDLPQAVASRLLAHSHTGERNREGQVHVVFTRGLLAGEAGVGRLLRYWGGEAVYAPWNDGAELDDPAAAEMLDRLKAIGRACIVEMELPVATLTTFGTVGQWLSRLYLGQAEGWEGQVRRDVPPDQIWRVLTRDDPRFVQLTRCNSWLDDVT